MARGQTIRGLWINSERHTQNLGIAGNLNIKSSAFGLDTFYSYGGGHHQGDYFDGVVNIHFLPNSKNNIEGTFTGVFLGSKGDQLNFLENSETRIAGGNFGVAVNSGGKRVGNLYLQKGSKVQIEGDTGLKLRKGSIILDPNVEDKEAPELRVFASKAAFSSVNFKTTDDTTYGKLKLTAKGHDMFQHARGSLRLVEGSKIDGNIWKSRNFFLTLEKGSKFFADELLSLKKLIVKGDLFVGTEESYEGDTHAGASHMTARVSKMNQKEIQDIIKISTMSEEEIKNLKDKNLQKAKETLEELDAVSGASYTLMKGMKKKSIETAKEIEYIHFGLGLADKPELVELLKETDNKVWDGVITLEEGKKILKEKFGISENLLSSIQTRDDFYGIRKVPLYIHQHNPKDYYKLHLNDGEFNLEDATIHLRLGGENNLSESSGEKTNHDTLKIGEKGIFQLVATVKIHPTDIEKVAKNDTFKNVLEIPKYQMVTRTKGIANLEPFSHVNIRIPETEIGPYVLEGKHIQTPMEVLVKWEDYNYDITNPDYQIRRRELAKLDRKHEKEKTKLVFEKFSRKFRNFSTQYRN